MRKVVPIAAGLILAVAALSASPARAQWFVRPYPLYVPVPTYPRPYYPPPVYQPAYPPPPIYAPPVYSAPVYSPPPPPRPSATLMETQRMLAQLGYDPGPVDGLAGPHLSDAVLAFQRDHGQSQTGRLTGETMGAIREASRENETQRVPVPVAGDSSSYGNSNSTSEPAPSLPRSTLSVKPSSP